MFLKNLWMIRSSEISNRVVTGDNSMCKLCENPEDDASQSDELNFFQKEKQRAIIKSLVTHFVLLFLLFLKPRTKLVLRKILVL